MEAATVLPWFAMAFIFLISSIWSEHNVKFGYVVTPFMVGMFWAIGWIQFGYLASVVPMIIMMGILSYLRTHLKTKFGVFGSSSGLIFKIVSFVIFLQFAIILLNGLTIFNTQLTQISSDASTYSIEKAQTVYASSTKDMNTYDAFFTGINLVWMQWNVLWTMVWGFFNIYGSAVNVFHVPPMLAGVLSAGIYMLTAIEVFVLIFKPYRAPEL